MLPHPSFTRNQLQIVDILNFPINLPSQPFLATTFYNFFTRHFCIGLHLFSVITFFCNQLLVVFLCSTGRWRDICLLQVENKDYFSVITSFVVLRSCFSIKQKNF